MTRRNPILVDPDSGEPATLGADVAEMEWDLAFGRPYQILDDQENWMTVNLLRLRGRLDGPAPLREDLVLHVLPDDDVHSLKVKDRGGVIGNYGLYRAEINCVALVPTNQFSALMTMAGTGLLRSFSVGLEAASTRGGKVVRVGFQNRTKADRQAFEESLA